MGFFSHLKRIAGIMKFISKLTFIFIAASLLIIENSYAGNKVMIFAAASTTNSLEEIAQNFSKKFNIKTTISFASSSTLARQIAMGAPANLYISANPKWMKYLYKRDMIKRGTRSNLLGNRIVIIVPSKSRVKINIKKGFRFPDLSGGKISMGDPDHVPAGIYAKKALMNLLVWKSVASKIIRAKDVRAALVYVERGEVPFGIVYSTDAAITKKVRVAGVFPENSHPEIVYQAGIVRGKGSENTEKFYNYLKTSEASKVFTKYGFTVYR